MALNKVTVNNQTELDDTVTFHKNLSPPFLEIRRKSVNNDGSFPFLVTFSDTRKAKVPDNRPPMNTNEVIAFIKNKFNLP